MHKKLFAFVLLPAVALGATAITIGTQVSAHGGGKTSISSELIGKLNLDEAKVEAAIQEIRAERKAEKQEHKQEKAQTRYEEWLSEAVEDGELTEAQKQLILAKRAELIAKFEAEKTALETWSSQNDIGLKYLVGGHKGLHGFGLHKGFWKFPTLGEESDD
ncbi:MAG TPA: hypothetical protein VFE94_01935 [Candidatus Paceibacterota bacterium]|nr:hypothetical protein [Candidatus Paceibacterota bacterium]